MPSNKKVYTGTEVPTPSGVLFVYRIEGVPGYQVGVWYLTYPGDKTGLFPHVLAVVSCDRVVSKRRVVYFVKYGWCSWCESAHCRFAVCS